LKDRKINTVPLPPSRALADEFIYPEKLNGRPDWVSIKRHLKREGCVKKKHFREMIFEVCKIFSRSDFKKFRK
jgi:hypothetical protein